MFQGNWPRALTGASTAALISFYGVAPVLAQDATYRLGPQDIIRIDVFNFPEFSSTQTVLQDGTVSLPFVGTVSLDGLTLKDAGTELSRKLSPFLRSPIVSVILSSARPIRVSLVGEIGRPGSYTIGGQQFSGTGVAAAELGTVGPAAQPLITLTRAIQLAGGISAEADVRRILVQRGQEQYRINLWNLLQTGDLSQDLRLADGDIIRIPTAILPNPQEAIEVASSNFSPTSITALVVGEVLRPGPQQIPPGIPFNQVILRTGGFTPNARRDKAQLVRLNPNGTVTRRVIALDFNQPVDPDKNPLIQNQDILIVDRSALAVFSETAQQLFSPFTSFAAITGLFRTFDRNR